MDDYNHMFEVRNSETQKRKDLGTFQHSNIEHLMHKREMNIKDRIIKFQIYPFRKSRSETNKKEKHKNTFSTAFTFLRHFLPFEPLLSS